jgi:NADPH2:quinone reductase
VGKISAEASLSSLKPRGWFISYGNASGPADPIPPGRLAAGGSLVMTRPTLFNFTDTPEALARASRRLFGLLAEGVLEADIGQRFPLKDAPEAHRALESGTTRGATLLMP